MRSERGLKPDHTWASQLTWAIASVSLTIKRR